MEGGGPAQISKVDDTSCKGISFCFKMRCDLAGEIYASFSALPQCVHISLK